MSISEIPHFSAEPQHEVSRPPVRPGSFNLPGETPGRAHPGFFWALLWCILFVLATQLPGAVIAVVVFFALMAAAPQLFPAGAVNNPDVLVSSKGMSIALAVAFLATELIVIGFSCLILRLVVGRDWWRRIGLHRLPRLSHVLVVLAAFPAMVLLANIAYAVFRLGLPSLGSIKGMAGLEQMVQVFSSWPAVFAVLVIGIGPGIGEELWCRGFLGRGLIAQHGAWLGVLFSSFFFGLIHIDPCQGAMAMLMGLWLHFTYLMTGSLWVPMLLHFLNNSLAVLAARIPGLESLDKPETLPGHLLIATVVLMTLAGYALYRSRAHLGRDEHFLHGVSGTDHAVGGVVLPRQHSWLGLAALLAGFVYFCLSMAQTMMG